MLITEKFLFLEIKTFSSDSYAITDRVLLLCTVVLNYSQGSKMGLKSVAMEGAPHDRKNDVLISMD